MAISGVKLKIEHKLTKITYHSNRCYGAWKLMYGFLKRKFVLVSVKTLILVIFIHLFSIHVPYMATGREFPSILGHSGSIFVVFVAGNHGNPEPITIFFEVLWSRVLKYAFTQNSEKSWKSPWYILVRSLKKLVIIVGATRQHYFWPELTFPLHIFKYLLKNWCTPHNF